MIDMLAINTMNRANRAASDAEDALVRLASVEEKVFTVEKKMHELRIMTVKLWRMKNTLEKRNAKLRERLARRKAKP